MQRFTSRFWRTFAGFLVGIVFTAACAWVFLTVEWSSPVAALFMHLIAAPVLGFMQSMSFTVIERAHGLMLPITMFIPYPVIFGALFYFWGERQTKAVVLWEAFVAVAFIGFGFFGFVNM